MNFYISDMHFNHTNIIKLCKRPFDTVYEMNETMIHNWNAKVHEDDTVYILGDIGFHCYELITRLHGRKILIIGNHDKPKEAYATGLFSCVTDYLEIMDKNVKIVLSHYPIVEWNGMYRGTIHMYGHIHNNENTAQKIMRSIVGAYNVGAEAIDYTPRNLNWFIEKSK